MKYIIDAMKILLELVLAGVAFLSLIFSVKCFISYNMVLGCMFIAIFIISVTCLLGLIDTF